MISEIHEIDEIYGRLRDFGADADPNLVEREKQRNAHWMRENPWLDYYEPHLDRERFDAERQERIRKEQTPVTNPIPNNPPITAGDPVDRYTGRQFFDAFRHSIRELDIRQTSRYAVSDWYSDLVDAGEKGYVSILLDPSDTHENLADEVSEWLMGAPASKSNFYVDDLKEELDAWVDFDPPPLRG